MLAALILLNEVAAPWALLEVFHHEPHAAQQWIGRST
jgi:hypothetical protein